MAKDKKKKDPTFSMDSDSPADQRAAEDGARAEETARAIGEGRENAGETMSEIREGRKKSLESVGVEADMRDLSDAIKSDGLTESEAGSRLLEKMQERGEVEPDTFEELPPEERERLAEAFEDSGSVEDAAAILEETLRQHAAGEGESVSDGDLVLIDDIAAEHGVPQERVGVTIKVDGEEQVVSATEAADGYMRTADYTRKTQEHARKVKEDRAEVREDADRLARQYDALGLALQQAGIGEQQLQAIEQQYQQARSLQEQYTEEQVRQAAQEGAEAVRQEFGWNSESDWSIAKAQLATTAEKLGFTPEEYGEVVDARYVKLLEYARRGMEGDTGRKDPPPMKPGRGNRNPATRRKSRASKDVQAARDRLARTGRVDDAAATLEGILSGGS